MQKHTKSLLEELSSMPLKRDKEEVVESRASHILESAIRLMTYIRENFDQDTAAVFTYTATRTGDHALLLNGSSSGTSDFGAGGTYRVSLTETGDDHPDVIGSNTTVVPGVATTGNLETGGDKDVFKVAGIAGVSSST